MSTALTAGNSKITRLLDKLDSAKAKIQKAKEEGEVYAGRVTHLALSGAGAAATGAIRGLMGDATGHAYIPGTKVDAEVAIGLGLGLAGVAGVAGKHSDNMVSFATGMLAPMIAEKTRDAIKTQAKK